MSRESDRHQELLEAARTLAIHLKYVEEDDDGQLVDLFVLDADDEEGMEQAAEEIEALIEQGSELVEVFEEDVDVAVEYIGKVLEDARPA